MKRYDLINWFIREYSCQRYLEIGVDNPTACYNRVQCVHKEGVDPNKRATYKMTSNDFFAQNKNEYDIIFIDGLHTCEQVLMDTINALGALSDNGTIILHDCSPTNEAEALPQRPPEGGSWYGDVWRAWATLRATARSLIMYTYMDDCGCGIIRRGSQSLYSGPRDTWRDFNLNRDSILLPIDDSGLLRVYGVTHG